jgi:hypothetical protein
MRLTIRDASRLSTPRRVRTAVALLQLVISRALLAGVGGGPSIQSVGAAEGWRVTRRHGAPAPLNDDAPLTRARRSRRVVTPATSSALHLRAPSLITPRRAAPPSHHSYHDHDWRSQKRMREERDEVRRGQQPQRVRVSVCALHCLIPSPRRWLHSSSISTAPASVYGCFPLFMPAPLSRPKRATKSRPKRGVGSGAGRRDQCQHALTLKTVGNDQDKPLLAVPLSRPGDFGPTDPPRSGLGRDDVPASVVAVFTVNHRRISQSSVPIFTL